MNIEAEMEGFYGQVELDLLEDLRKTNPLAYARALEQHRKDEAEREALNRRRAANRLAALRGRKGVAR